ncbi:MAG: hypothetical protein RL217_1943 [Pseudomonadota bacterium]|jgi:sulfite reductase (NADPH) hemoprotein beta-component
MYIYDEIDKQLLNERLAQFSDQMQRYLDGKLADNEFLPLRLQNGLYRQRYAPMYRIAVPYGMLTSTQLRKIAHIARTYDKGFAHVTTRQNFQLHWTRFEECPQIFSELAEVNMHSIQTSGNVIRNTTTDEYAGILPQEVADPRPYAELIRQWSTFHPEFSYLPRKFKICVNADPDIDRAALTINDIGVNIRKNAQGEIGYRIYVGGGLGRTPMVGEVINDFVPEEDLITYLGSIMRVYNQFARRDNKFKSRIKILVKAIGIARMKELVEAEWVRTRDSEDKLTRTEIVRVQKHFTEPAYLTLENGPAELLNPRLENREFARWLDTNIVEHKKSGYAAVTLTLKRTGDTPGDISSEQMDEIAALADEYSFSEIRNTHQQNMVLADVEQRKLYELWKKLVPLGLSTANLNLLTDVICCSGGDYCALANAKSIPIAEAIQDRFDDLDYVHDLGPIDFNVSGCMNACGHHHVANIGVLGVDKKGEEFYQIAIGGKQGFDAKIANILGPSVARAEVPNIITKILDFYVAHRLEDEIFVDTYYRLGHDSFKEHIYGNAH